MGLPPPFCHREGSQTEDEAHTVREGKQRESQMGPESPDQASPEAHLTLASPFPWFGIFMEVVSFACR